VVALLEAGDRVAGVRLENGAEVRAHVVVNATGVWSDRVQGMEDGGASRTIRPAKGIHLTFPAERLPASAAAVLPVASDRRSVFVVPWGDFTYAGTTDTDYSGPLDDPQCTPEDVAYVLDAINGSMTSPVTTDDVVASWAGLRPLVSSAHSERTADLSRRHRVTRSRGGLVTVTGGKLTTYRRMASDTVDQVVEHLGRGARRCPTKRLALLGAPGFETLRQPDAPARLGVGAGVLSHLASRYGTEARTVIALMEADPELGHPLVPGLPYLRAEAVYAARYEMAWTLEDVLARRTRASFLARDAAAAAAPSVARLIAPELGWSVADCERQANRYRESVRRARDAAGLPDTSGVVDDRSVGGATLVTGSE
jgi:glycerol-3-phosphate dehydrogenase